MMRLPLLISCCLLAIACGAADDALATNEQADEPALGQKTQELFSDPNKTMLFVAHQDDDLGMNPDLARTIASGAQVRAVTLTNGDIESGCNAYDQGRFEGQRRAYALMAGKPVDTVWTEAVPMAQYNGRKVRLLSLPGTQISVLYVGLPSMGSKLQLLWDDPTQTTTTIPTDLGRRQNGVVVVDTYNRADLIETLRQIIADFAPNQVNTLDSSKLWPMTGYPNEHTDHVHSALFALAALQRYAGNVGTRFYRGYNQWQEYENVSAVDKATKVSVFGAYIPYDTKICAPGATSMTICGSTQACDLPALYIPFESRQYAYVALRDIQGGLAGPSNLCMKAASGSVGASVSMAACDMSSNLQEWRFGTDGTVRHPSSGLCLAALGGSKGTALTLRTCTGALEQKFLLTTATQLRGPDSTCVRWASGSLTIQECVNNANQLGFRMQSYPAVFTAESSNFTDASVPDNYAYYGSLSMGDIDGDGDSDVCVRRSGGIYCAQYNAGSKTFTGYALKIASFRDADGYGDVSRGSTVQLGDITGDGRADVCGFGGDGIYCATSNGSTFGGYSKRSLGTSFASYGAAASRYRSLRLVDVNGDNKADVCGRNVNGIECALNNGSGSFGATSYWIADYSDALGWNTAHNGATIRFADIDGDGKQDVCGRGAGGLLCALNDSFSQFNRMHLWSDTGDLSDGEGWSLNFSGPSSIRLADINGDGRADACARSTDGIRCGLSTGQAFTTMQLLVPVYPYNNADGWGADRYGSNPLFGQLDNDGHADLCVRGPIPGGGVGLRCTYAP